MAEFRTVDAQAQIIAIAQGLGIPDPHSWTWLEPGALRLICQAIAKQAAHNGRLEQENGEMGMRLAMIATGCYRGDVQEFAAATYPYQTD